MRIGGSQSHVYLGPKIRPCSEIRAVEEVSETVLAPEEPTKAQVVIVQPKTKKGRKKRLRNALVELKEQR